MSHTPGPWRLIDGKSEVVAGDCYHVAYVKAWFPEHSEEQEANARLIASAPEMRELLECVAMSPIDLENDGECCMRIKTETMFRIASLVFGKQITEIQTLAGQLVTSADQTSAIGGIGGKVD